MPPTTIAKFLLTRSDADRLASAIEEDETLAEFPVGVGQAPAGDWQVTVYLPETPRQRQTAALAALATRVLGAGSGFSVEPLPDIDWVAESLAGLSPVAAGRFLVHGRHDRHRRRPNAFNIEIEAGQAFGTGHHGTTAGCLLAIDRLTKIRRIRNALDVGTGSGVLAIAIAKAAKAPVLATDIDPVAVRIARENLRLNGVAGKVRAIAAAGLKKHVVRQRVPFDLIVANILAGPLAALAPELAGALAPRGILVLSGLLPDQRARILAAYRGQGLALRTSSVRDGWLTLTFARKNRGTPSPKLKRAKPSAPPFVIL